MSTVAELYFLKMLAHSNHWGLLWPELSLTLLSLILLIGDTVLPRLQGMWTKTVIGGQALILGIWGFQYFLHGPSAVFNAFSGLIVQGNWIDGARALLVLGAMGTSLLGAFWLKGNVKREVPFYYGILWVTVALMVLVQANHGLLLFVALECAGLGTVFLVASGEKLSLQMGLRLLVLTGASGAVSLLGLTLIYGAGTLSRMPFTLYFDGLSAFLSQSSSLSVASVGLILVLASLLFKIGGAPFQFWIPSVYQAAPLPVTAFLAICSKTAAFVVFVRLMMGPGSQLPSFALGVLSGIVALTLILGHLSALGQHYTKRLMASSSIAQAGYLLIGALSAVYLPVMVHIILGYLLIYALSSFCVFGVMVFHQLSHRTLAPGLLGNEESLDASEEVAHYAGLGRRDPFLGGVLAFGLASLAGIPPFAGFISKLLLLLGAFQAQLYALAAVGLLGVVVSVAYYLGWIREVFFEEPLNPTVATVYARTPWQTILLVILAGSLLVLGFYQGPLFCVPSGR